MAEVDLDTPKGDPRKWLVFGAVATGVYAWVMDTSMVAVALPQISEDFSAGLPTVQWVVLGYLLAITTLMLPIGRAADLRGRKPLYLLGFAVYIAGAFLAASAQNVPWLLAARIVQAVGSASVQVNGLAIAISAFPEEERGKVFGMNVLTVSVGAISGPIIGGVLIDSFGWPSIFVLTGVMATVAMGAVSLVYREARPREGSERRRLDWAGMVTSAVVTVALVFIISQGHSSGWTSPLVLSAAVAAVVGMGVFWSVEMRCAHPMLDLRLIAPRRISLGTFARYLSFVNVVGTTVALPFYFQGVLERSATTTGLLLTPFAVALGISAPISGRLSDRIGPTLPMVIGLLLVFTGLFSMSRLDAHSPLMHPVLSSLAMGLGMGTFSPANSSAVLGGVGRADYGLVTAFVEFMRNMGQITGVAITTLVITLGITAMGVEPDLGLLRQEGASAHLLLSQGFIDGMRRTYVVLSSTTVLCLVIAVLAMREGPVPAPWRGRRKPPVGAGE